MYFGVWNIRGLGDPLRQAEVRNLIYSNELCSIGLVETKVPEARFCSISVGLLSGWKWIANYDSSLKGRIWVSWNPSLVKFEVISSNSQAIHGRVKLIMSRLCFCTSVIHAEHTFVSRRPLWADLVQMSACLQNVAWLVAGDFNDIRDPSDWIGGSDNWIHSFDEFNQCLFQAELEDLRYVGFRFTWSTSSGVNRKVRKIDRVLVNAKWSLEFSYLEVPFLTPGISDHTPMEVKVL